MCPPVSPHKGASIVQFPAQNAYFFGMETPLRGRSGGHTGTAPTVLFGQIMHGRLVLFGWIVRKWLFCLCGMRGKILRRLVGAVPVCPPVSPCKGASVVKSPCTMCVFLVWKRRCADVRAGMQAPPLRILLERIARGCLPLRFRLGRLRMDGWFRLGGLCVGGWFRLGGLRV